LNRRGQTWRPLAVATVIAVTGLTPAGAAWGQTIGSARLAAATQHLSQAIQIPTVSYDPGRPGSEAPFVAFRDFLAQAYPNAARRLNREVSPGGALLFTWTGSRPTSAPLIFIAHQDVVPIAESSRRQWRHPPFGGEIAEGYVWGRGAIDMKSQLVAIMESVEDLARRGFTPERTIYLVFDNDEETAGSGALRIARLLEARKVHAEMALDEGPGALDRFELTGRRDAFIGVAEKGYGTLVLSARERGGHSSVPALHPAIERLARGVIAVRSVRMPRRVDGLTRQTLEALAPELPAVTSLAIRNLWLTEPLVRAGLEREAATDALIGTTIAPTMLAGSAAENVSPDLATATFNLRFHPRDRPDAVMAKVRARISSIPGLEAAWASPPTPASPVSSTHSPGYALIADQARKVFGDVAVTPLLVFGATDSRFFQAAAAQTYRFQPIVVTASDMETVHGVNERLSIANIERSVRFFDSFIPMASKSP